MTNTMSEKEMIKLEQEIEKSFEEKGSKRSREGAAVRASKKFKFAIQETVFRGVVKEILKDLEDEEDSNEAKTIADKAVQILRRVTEDYIEDIFTKAQAIADFNKRKTVQKIDFKSIAIAESKTFSAMKSILDSVDELEDSASNCS